MKYKWFDMCFKIFFSGGSIIRNYFLDRFVFGDEYLFYIFLV